MELSNNASSNVDDLAPGAELGDYSIRRKAGEGGFAVVYEGEHRALKKRVAIKLLLPHQAGSVDVVQRFLREGEAVARLEHPNVVDVVHVGTFNDVPYLVMEFLEGEDLGSLLDREPVLQAERLADIMVPVLSAVAAAHDAGIVHRDLKPDNIFLCYDKRGRVTPKVLDFGISKVSSEGVATLNLTASDAILGTPYYMSPEQAQGARLVDKRSDVFALGVILYEAATGKRPFEGDSLYGVLTSIVVHEPPAPSEVWVPFEPALEATIIRALRKKPEERFQDVREMGRDLLKLAGERVRINYEHDFGGEGSSTTAAQSPSSRAGGSSSAQPRSTSASGHASASQRWKPFALAAASATILAAGWVVAASLRNDGADKTTTADTSDVPKASAQTSQASANAEPDPSPSAAVAAQPAPPEVPPEPSTRHVVLRAQPSSAELYLDGERVGRGVADLELPDDGHEHTLRVEAKGYATREVSFEGANVPPPVELERRRVTKAPARPARRKQDRGAEQAADQGSPPSPSTSAAPPKPEEAAARRGANDALILR